MRYDNSNTFSDARVHSFDSRDCSLTTFVRYKFTLKSICRLYSHCIRLLRCCIVFYIYFLFVAKKNFSEFHTVEKCRIYKAAAAAVVRHSKEPAPQKREEKSNTQKNCTKIYSKQKRKIISSESSPLKRATNIQLSSMEFHFLILSSSNTSMFSIITCMQS
jgi:hypothetical protein